MSKRYSRDSGWKTWILHPHLSNQIWSWRSMERKTKSVSLYLKNCRIFEICCNNRIDLGFSVGLLSRYMSEPRVSHIKATRRILRCLKGSTNYGIIFSRDSKSKEVEITCYSDADWYWDKEDRRNITIYFFQVFGALISWCSRK